jgi:hypothetical protein
MTMPGQEATNGYPTKVLGVPGTDIIGPRNSGRLKFADGSSVRL